MLSITQRRCNDNDNEDSDDVSKFDDDHDDDDDGDDGDNDNDDDNSPGERLEGSGKRLEVPMSLHGHMESFQNQSVRLKESVTNFQGLEQGFKPYAITWVLLTSITGSIAARARRLSSPGLRRNRKDCDRARQPRSAN